MLTLRVEVSAGMDLRDQMLPKMLDLSRRLGCRVEAKGNDTLFWVHPSDDLRMLHEAFDRLYPASAIVSTRIRKPVPRTERS